MSYYLEEFYIHYRVYYIFDMIHLNIINTEIYLKKKHELFVK